MRDCGSTVARILRGFSMRVLAFDRFPSEECRELGVEYVELDSLLEEADIVKEVSEI